MFSTNFSTEKIPSSIRNGYGTGYQVGPLVGMVENKSKLIQYNSQQKGPVVRFKGEAKIINQNIRLQISQELHSEPEPLQNQNLWTQNYAKICMRSPTLHDVCNY